MTRTQAIQQIRESLDELPDDRVEALAVLAKAWKEAPVFHSLPADSKVAIEAAIDELDRGEGIDWALVKAGMDDKIKAHEA